MPDTSRQVTTHQLTDVIISRPRSLCYNIREGLIARAIHVCRSTEDGVRKALIAVEQGSNCFRINTQEAEPSAQIDIYD